MFNTIGIVGKFSDPSVSQTITTLVQFLGSRQKKILLEKTIADSLHITPAPQTVELATLGQHCDLAIVVGGDGTLLHAARALADHGIPLVGINLGRLGFLVDISPDEMLARMDEILAGHFDEDTRFLLESQVVRNDAVVNEGNAFNDVVVHKWNSVRMIEFETYVNDQLVHSQRSDGLIVSTPTGSTAYALSSGGPILYPSLDAIVLVPVCPHTLSNRPLVISSDSLIEVAVKQGHQNHVRVTLDGQLNFGLQDGDRIKIKKKDKPVRLIHPEGHDHFQILRAKLRWG
ncbi:MAG: NAD(+) kinase [Gammaproteobacteria bacterium]|nr:NAD(+) kinase [Gammaproteobacteria bacterium]